MKIFLSILFVIFWATVFAQNFAPPAEIEGTTAVSVDNNLISGWATNCVVVRGYFDIKNVNLGYVDFGTENNATGVANNSVVSLGDGGYAILSFDQPIKNHQGFDFAIFENSFSNNFLELAFVEVSSDGENYVRFPAISNTQSTEQINGFGTLDATYIHNFAGKYRQGFGTPFDLSDLQDSTNIDLQNIQFIKIVDVVGCIDNGFANYDSENKIINDPYPTPFATGGFDLDAVAILREPASNIENYKKKECRVFPNPARKGEFINIQTLSGKIIKQIDIYSISGQKIQEFSIENYRVAALKLQLNSGIYFMHITFTDNSFEVINICF